MSRAIIGLFVAALLALTAGPSSAQSAAATLSGKVRTEDGTPVADAVVIVRDENTGQLRTTITDAAGRYRFASLEPGTWAVLARLDDGAVSEPRTVELRLQQSVQLDFTVGDAYTERVTVTAENPLVDLTETGGTLRITGGQADDLPVSGRNFTDLALLDASARQAAPGAFAGERGAVFTVNGQSGRSNAFHVDGMDNNDPFGGTTVNSFLSQQVIDEFVLMTHQFAPEFGRATGGVLNVVTRHGTNDFQIEGFAQGGRGRWGDTVAFLDGLPGDAQSGNHLQLGVNFGGPFRKDRAHYFVAYEHLSADDIAPFTGFTRDGTRGGVLVAPSRDDNLFARFDFNLGTDKMLMFRLTANDARRDGLNVGGVNTPEAGFDLTEEDLQLAGSLSIAMSPRLLSETRFLASTSRFRQRARSSLTGVTRPSSVFGGNQLASQARDSDLFQVVQNFTWIRGRHTMKLGLDVLRSSTDIAAGFNPNGGLIYRNDRPLETGDCEGFFNVFDVLGADDDGRRPCPGDPNMVDDDDDEVIDELVDFRTYPLVFALVDGDANAEQNDTQISFFVQDRWQALPRWMLEYGLRYDLNTYVLPGNVQVDSSIPNGGSDRDRDNLSPRLGFTHDLFGNGRTMLRGGAGLFYDKLVLAFPAAAAVTSGTTIRFFFPQAFGVPTDESYIAENGLAMIPLGALDEVTLRFSTATDLETPYNVQYNLGVETRTGPTSAFRADLISSRGHDQSLMRDLNPVVCVPADPGDPINFDCPSLPEHRDPTTGSIAAITTDGRSWYEGLDLKWHLQGEDHWVRASYTLSRSENLGSDPLKNGITLPQDSDDLNSERARSDDDRKHRLVLSGDLPLGLWGLRLSGVAQYASGLPFNVVTGTDENLDGFVNERPVGVPRNAGEEASIAAIDAIRAEEGLSPAPALSEPDFAQLDVRLYRPFLAEDGLQGQLYLQVFNLFNRENGGLIEGRVTSDNFGRPIGLAGPPRTVELGLRIGF